MPHRHNHAPRRRRGVATVEAAVLLPILTVLMLGTYELGWHVHCAQVLNNAARQGARAAVYLENSNAEVVAAVNTSLKNSVGLESDAVTVQLSKLNAEGYAEYQIQNLNENEQGQPVRVMVSVDGADLGFLSNMLGLKSGSISSYAVMRRRE